jgi:hypothetical protein
MLFAREKIFRKSVAALTFISLTMLSGPSAFSQQTSQAYDYRVLATNKTSTMQKEMSEAADAGYRMEKVMGGNTALGGSEVVVIMAKTKAELGTGRYAYKLLATNKTSTMQKELQEAGDEGFDYRDQTVFNSAFGGDEVVVILELNRERTSKVRYEYKLLATTKTSTMQKELQEAGDSGFKFVGVTVSKTAFGGKEVVSVLRKEVAQ